MPIGALPNLIVQSPLRRMILTDKQEIKALVEVAKLCKLDPTSLKPFNPFTQKGPKAEIMQIGAAQLHPEIAAKWRQDAGLTINLATAAAEAGIIEHNSETRADLVSHNPLAARQYKADQEDKAQKLEQWLKDEAVKSAQRNGKKIENYEQLEEQSNQHNYGHGWQGQALRRQHELTKAMAQD